MQTGPLMYGLLFFTSSAITLGLIYFLFKKYDHKEALTIVAASFALITSLITSTAAFNPEDHIILSPPAGALRHHPKSPPPLAEPLPPRASYNWIKVGNNEVVLDDTIMKQPDQKKNLWTLNGIVKNNTNQVIGDIEIYIAFQACATTLPMSKTCKHSQDYTIKQLHGIYIDPYKTANIFGNFEITPNNQNYRFNYKIINYTTRENVARLIDMTPTCGDCGR
jgi:hypothetical protein